MPAKSLRIADLKHQIGRFRRNARRGPSQRWGRDFVQEYATRIKPEPKIIFDVGGFIGLNALRYSDAFPTAKVYTFEPTSENLRAMDDVLAGKPDIIRKQLAVGAETGTLKIAYDQEHPSMSRAADSTSKSVEEVPLTTIDQFADDENIGLIDILKIDTEGHELEVLKGAQGVLAASRVGVLILECGFRPNDDIHLNYADLSAVLFGHDYRLFGFYDQWEDTLNPGPDIRRADVAFVAPHIWNA